MTRNAFARANTARRLRSPGVVAGLLLSISAVGFWVGHGLPLSDGAAAFSADGPALHVDPEALNFGEAWAQPDFEWTLPVTNTSSADVHVLGIEQSCRCTSVEPKSFVLRPGQTQRLRVTLDLTEGAPSANGASARPFSVYLTAAVAGRPSSEERWYLQGKVRSWITATPGTIYLGEVSVSSPEMSPSRLVALKPHTAVSRLTAHCRSDLAELRVAQDVDAACYSLEVVPKLLPLGPVDFRIRLAAETASGERLPDAYLPVRGAVVPDVYCVPERLFLGALPLGEAAARTLSLRSRAGLPFSISSVESDDPRLVVEPLDSPADGFQFRLSQTSATVGLHSTRVRFRIRSRSDDTDYEITSAVHYVGLQPSDSSF